jgi:hypothetical protein
MSLRMGTRDPFKTTVQKDACLHASLRAVLLVSDSTFRCGGVFAISGQRARPRRHVQAVAAARTWSIVIDARNHAIAFDRQP